MITYANESRYHELLFVIIALVLIAVSSSVNAGNSESKSISRSQCTSVQQEIVDFETLEKKIRKTNAIGVMAKLKLSSDIKKLLADIKAFHAGNTTLTLEQQREQYDLLYMKVVSLVQEKDPELYNQLCSAWDPVWVALQDESNLEKVSLVFSIDSMAIVKITDVIMTFISAFIPSASAGEDLSHDDIVKQDLFIVITLHGAHCKAVIDYERTTDQDYVAVCESGDKYRVHISADGRVNMAPYKQ